MSPRSNVSGQLIRWLQDADDANGAAHVTVNDDVRAEQKGGKHRRQIVSAVA
jgi:hypothetical protein